MLQLICRILVSSEANASKIATSMAEEPEKWTWDDYYATHKSGVAVWIANHAYGLHVQPNGRNFDSEGDRWKPSWAERHLINREAQKVIARRAAKAKRTAHKLLADRLAE